MIKELLKKKDLLHVNKLLVVFDSHHSLIGLIELALRTQINRYKIFRIIGFCNISWFYYTFSIQY